MECHAMELVLTSVGVGQGGEGKWIWPACSMCCAQARSAALVALAALSQHNGRCSIRPTVICRSKVAREQKNGFSPHPEMIARLSRLRKQRTQLFF